MLLGFATKENPLLYLSFIVPAQMTALACASSSATLQGFQHGTRQDPQLYLSTRGNYQHGWICSLFTLCLHLVHFEWRISKCCFLHSSHYFVHGWFGRGGPFPASGLVLVITAYNTVFGGTGSPNGFEFIVAIDWFVDRVVTALNITGDTVVSRVIAHTTDIEDEITTSPSIEEKEIR